MLVVQKKEHTKQNWLVVGPPLWKIWKSIGMIIPNIWENKKCSKPPTREDKNINKRPKEMSTWILGPQLTGYIADCFCAAALSSASLCSRSWDSRMLGNKAAVGISKRKWWALLWFPWILIFGHILFLSGYLGTKSMILMSFRNLELQKPFLSVLLGLLFSLSLGLCDKLLTPPHKNIDYDIDLYI